MKATIIDDLGETRVFENKELRILITEGKSLQEFMFPCECDNIVWENSTKVDNEGNILCSECYHKH